LVGKLRAPIFDVKITLLGHTAALFVMSGWWWLWVH